MSKKTGCISGCISLIILFVVFVVYLFWPKKVFDKIEISENKISDVRLAMKRMSVFLGKSVFDSVKIRESYINDELVVEQQINEIYKPKKK